LQEWLKREPSAPSTSIIPSPSVPPVLWTNAFLAPGRIACFNTTHTSATHIFDLIIKVIAKDLIWLRTGFVFTSIACGTIVIIGHAHLARSVLAHQCCAGAVAFADAKCAFACIKNATVGLVTVLACLRVIGKGLGAIGHDAALLLQCNASICALGNLAVGRLSAASIETRFHSVIATIGRRHALATIAAPSRARDNLLAYLSHNQA